MSVLPVSQPLNQPQSLLKENAISKDLTLAREINVNRDFSPVREGENRGAETAKEPSRADETISAFRRIFLEKKAEKESAAAEKSGMHEKNGAETLHKNADVSGKKIKEALKQVPFAKEGQTPATVKEILSGLVEKSLKTKEPVSKKDKLSTKEKDIDNRRGERNMMLRDRLELSRQRETDGAALRSIAAKTGHDKPERQVVVIDLRDRAAEKTKPTAPPAKTAAQTTADKTETREAKKTLDAKDSFDTRFFTRNAAQADRADAGQRSGGEPAARFRSDFSTRMADIMKNDMVKHTGLVLKNNGSGEIHLVLKPESLGSVRMKLSMEDNHIVGKIIVDNNMVKEIMEENLGHLETALHQNGYETAAFNVFVAGDQKQAPQGDETFERLADIDREAGTPPVKEYEANGASFYADSLVNILM